LGINQFLLIHASHTLWTIKLKVHIFHGNVQTYLRRGGSYLDVTVKVNLPKL